MGAVYGQTLGIVGCGNIGRTLARKAAVFGLEVIGYDPYLDPTIAASAGIRLVSLDELMANSDYVSVHTNLTPETRHLIGQKELDMMKPSAFILNTSRGPVVDEAALIEALQEGKIAGAGLDVFEKEPPDPDSPLLKMDNVVVMPHSASYSDAAFSRLRRSVAQEAVRVLSGRWPNHVVNTRVTPKKSLQKE